MLRERNGVYDPEDLSYLGRIFDEVVATLPATMRTPANRTEIAKLILTREAAGEIGLASLIELMTAVSSAA